VCSLAVRRRAFGATKPFRRHAGAGHDQRDLSGDAIYGQAGDDSLHGRAGNDVIYAGAAAT
jgi:Ca2+-binding RTX toxin-like protein